MTEFLKALRRGRGGHRDVFAEFAAQILFAVALSMAARRGRRRPGMAR